jgi:hypothetical protein
MCRRRTVRTLLEAAENYKTQRFPPQNSLSLLDSLCTLKTSSLLPVNSYHTHSSLPSSHNLIITSTIHTVISAATSAIDQTTTSSVLSVDSHTQTHKHIHTNTYTQTHTHKHIHTNTYTQTHTHKHIHTNTYTHTQSVFRTIC